MKSSVNVLLGILGAAAAGVVIGMLIAPEKGEDIRKGIKNSAGDIAKKLGDLLASGKASYEDLKGDLREDAEEIKNDVAGAYRKAKA